ncbi:MAG: hypothetical protein NC412_00115 [Roseburia sp.]|nr:hypothetical protein [Roseburia sp.]MCM1277785.1 hypothetical protein [Robinsoniella sp.]
MTEKKIREIIEITDKFLPKRFEKNLAEIKDNYKKNPMIYAKGYLDSLKNLFTETKKLQEEGKKGKVAYISFSFLYSSALLNKNGLRIDIYDKDFYLDKQEVSDFWEPLEIFRYVKEDMKYVERYLGSSYIPIKPHERVELYNSYLINYYQVTMQVLLELVKGIEKMSSFNEMRKERKVEVTFGEYMDKFQCIHTI